MMMRTYVYRDYIIYGVLGILYIRIIRVGNLLLPVRVRTLYGTVLIIYCRRTFDTCKYRICRPNSNDDDGGGDGEFFILFKDDGKKIPRSAHALSSDNIRRKRSYTVL